MSANSDTATPWPPETRRRRHLSAVGLAKAEAADMREAGIGSTAWFDGSLFNAESAEAGTTSLEIALVSGPGSRCHG